MSQQTTNRSFDDLARALAEGTISRRRALKLFAGTAIAALIPSTRAMAAITCPPGTVKICHVPRRADGTCRRGEAETRCVTPEAAARHAAHPCDCCGGCGGTDNCREPRPRTCFSTTTCLPDGGTCSTGGTPCCSGNCSGGICACPAGSVELSNGTCATPCIATDCPGCFGCAQAISDNYCANLGGGAPCATDSECPTGEFCSGFICRVACTPSAPPPV